MKRISRKQPSRRLYERNSSFQATQQFCRRYARRVDTPLLCVEMNTSAIWIFVRNLGTAENDEADDVLDCLHSAGRVIEKSLHINETPAA